MYNEWYHEVDGEITAEGTAFIQALSNEVETLALVIWEKNSHLHKVKTGKDQKPFTKKDSKYASLMSVIFQTEERKMLMAWDAFLAHNKRYLAVFIHDGGYVEKLEKETQFPPELLEEGARMVERETGIGCVLTQKDIVYDWTPKKPQEDQYARLKVEFEKHTFLVGTQLYHIMRYGTTSCYMTVRDAAIKFAPLEVDVWLPDKGKSETRKFLDMWIKDPERLAYDRVDFFPTVDKCPSSVYNLFKGFNAEKYRPETPMSPETIKVLVQPIITHMNFLTTDNSSYLLKQFANILQNPGAKAEVAALIRDQGDLLTEGGGTGKNMLIEFFGNKIVGEEYCIVVGDNKELYAGFNSLFEAKLLVFVEEACSKDNHSNNDSLKSRITSKKTNINKKMVAQYEVKDFTNYIFTSNNRNPLPIKQGNRRFCVFDTDPAKRGDVKYFNDLAAHLENPEVIWAFYMYLKGLETYRTPAEFSAEIPVTDAMRDIRVQNASVYLKWLVDRVERGRLYSAPTNDLYSAFVSWVSKNKEKSMDSLISQTEFGCKLANTKSIHLNELAEQGTKRKKHGNMYMEWNVTAVVCPRHLQRPAV
jgi:hypothetical protein